MFYDHQGKVLAKTKIITKALPPKEKLAFQENSLNWYWTDKGGTYAGEVTKKDVKGYTIVYNPAMMSIAGGRSGKWQVSDRYVPVSFLKDGYTTVRIYDAAGKLVARQTLSNLRAPETLVAIETKEVALTAPVIFSYRDLFNVTEQAGKEPEINGITLSQHIDAPIRLAQKPASWDENGHVDVQVNDGDLYIDYDRDGTFSIGDRPLATLNIDIENAQAFATTGIKVKEPREIEVHYGEVSIPLVQIK